MPNFDTESQYARGNLDGEDGMDGRKEWLVARHKVGQFIAMVEAISSRLYHFICEISHEGIRLSMQVTKHLV